MTTLSQLILLNSQANGPKWVLSDPAFDHVRLSYIPDADRQLADLARNMLPQLLAVVEAAKALVEECRIVDDAPHMALTVAQRQTMQFVDEALSALETT